MSNQAVNLGNAVAITPGKSARQSGSTSAVSAQQEQYGFLAIIDGMIAAMQAQNAQYGESATQTGTQPQDLMSLFAVQGMQNPLDLQYLSELLADQNQLSGAQFSLPTDFMAQLQTLMENPQNTGMSELISTFSQATPQAISQAILQQSGTMGQADTQQTNQLGMPFDLQILSAQQEGSTASDPFSALTAQGQLRVALTAAKQSLSEQPQQGQSELEFDIDALQARIDGAKTSFADSFVSSVQEAQAPPVLEQLEQALTQNLQQEKSEFVLKLKPEMLGEVLVKLTEIDGKMTLQISAANAQAAKLINDDIAALRQAMAPMQIEVSQAVTAASESSQADLFSGGMFGQAFSGQSGFAWQSGQSTTVYYPSETEQIETPVQQAGAQQVLSAGALNIYV